MEANHRILDIMVNCLDRPDAVESQPCWSVSKNISISAVVDLTTNTLTSLGHLQELKLEVIAKQNKLDSLSLQLPLCL